MHLSCLCHLQLHRSGTEKSHEYPFAGDIVYVRSHEPLL